MSDINFAKDIPGYKRPEAPYEPPKERTPVPLPQIYHSIEQNKDKLLPLTDLPIHVQLSKRVQTASDIEPLLKSQGIHSLLFYIQQACAVIVQCENKESSGSEIINQLLELLNMVNAIIDRLPAEDNGRFGSKTFRQVLEAINQIKINLSVDYINHELEFYFHNSFGNYVRIDYGSGHEMNFVAFLACLYRLGLFKIEEELRDSVIVIFNKYLKIVRKLQRVYRLEPAGSHGVWGLDDFQFVSYIFGSAQIIGHKLVKPKSILNQDMLLGFSDKYMYLGCIKFIGEMKRGPFHEHSPMLFDISGVPNWEKVNLGLMKMYVKEVLEKVPIVQHFELGSLLKWDSI